jgi:acyl-ACP thioesterase
MTDTRPDDVTVDDLAAPRFPPAIEQLTSAAARSAAARSAALRREDAARASPSLLKGGTAGSTTVTAMSTPAPTMVAAGPGRRYTGERVVRLGDVEPSGRVRLDALAGYLQDIASDDGEDAGIEPELAWLVRRSALRVYRRPRYLERVELVTWASGRGGRWAERRTTITLAGRVMVEASALWVCVDLATMRPVRLSDRFWLVYGESTGGRAVSPRLLHPRPPASAAASGRPWPLRLADLDLFDHVNNAATWAAVDDELARVAPAGRVEWAELEYRLPIEPDANLVLASRVDGAVARLWLMDGATVLASAAAGLGVRHLLQCVTVDGRG